MSDERNHGLWSWRQMQNNNHMIALQKSGSARDATPSIELSYFASSAFRITSPSGVSIMIDPWRNPPWGGWDWYLHEFPETEVDIGISTHAHFDHDALHRLNANMLLDRLIGTYQFCDVVITGFAEKHVSDTRHSMHDWATTTKLLYGINPAPPNNPRSFDNSLILIESGGLRVLHWGDNRPDPDPEIWERLGEVDIVLLPVDQSRHVLSYEQADRIMDRLNAKIAVPHHYYIWDIVTRGSTLLPADEWVESHSSVRRPDSGSVSLAAADVKSMTPTILHFGDHVAFEKPIKAKAHASGLSAP